MVEKPISGDEEQRRAQTRAAREQSGLPPEEHEDQEYHVEQEERKREDARNTEQAADADVG